MVQSTIPTSTSFVTSTNSGISISISTNHSTVFTYSAVPSNSSGFSQHSINSADSTSSIWHHNIHSHQGDKRLLTIVAPMALTSIPIGKRTKITMTTRRSTA